MKTYSVNLLATETVANDTKKFIFEKPKNYSFVAGQFLMIKFTPKLSRAYSIASPNNEDFLELLVRILPNGQGSKILVQAQIGEKFAISNPLGHFKLSENQSAELFFCCTGTGIAPFKSMIKTEAQKKSPRPITLFYGGREFADLAYLTELNNWHPNLKIKIGLSQTPNPAKKDYLKAEIAPHRITNFIETTEFNNFAEFYICGNKEMVLSTTKLLENKGISREKIFFERFN